MTLRRQTVIAAGAVLFSLVVMLYFVSQTLVMSSYLRLEDGNTRHKVQETLNALDNQIRTIATITSDWAIWDDTYAFIQDGNQAYIRSNLVDGTFKALELNTMLFIDSSGSLVYGKAYDLINEEETPVSQGLLNFVTPDSLLLNHSGPDSIKSGILLLPENPMLIVSYPILPSEGQGPIRGSLITGRYLDNQEITILSEMGQENISIVRLDTPALLEEYRAVSQTLSASIPIAVRPLDDRTVAGYTFIKDIYGKPALILSVKTGRDIYTQGQNTVAYFILALVVIGLLTGLALIVFLDRQVLSRVSLLSRGVIKIAESGNLSGRVPAAGEDELANLGTAINVMIETLHNTSELMKQKNQLLDARNDDLQKEISGRQQAEQLYLSLAQNSSTGIYIFQDGKFRFVNAEFQRQTGYTEEELLNMSPYEIVHPEDREQARANAIQMLKGERQSPYEFRSVNKKGLTWAMESVSSIIYDGKRATLGTFMDITEHKKLEEELFLRSQLLNSAGDYIGLLDPSRNFKYVNEAYCKAHGYTAEELIGKNISYLDPVGPDEITEKTMKEKNEAVFESRHTRKDGTMFDVEVHARIIYINNERLSLNVEHDITERKQMEKELRESEEKYRSLVDNSLAGVYRTNLKGNILYVNGALASMFGFESPEEMIAGGVLARYKSPGDRTSFIKELTDKSKVNNFQFQVITKNGEVRTVIMNAVLNGDIISGMIIDTTERRAAEEKLQESEERFRNLVMNAPVGIILSTASGNVIDVNSALLKMHGYETKEEFVRTSVSDRYYDPHDRDRWLALVREQGKVEGFEVELKCKDGTSFWASFNTLPQEVQSGEQRFIIVIQDITERRQMERRLQETNRSLDAQNEELIRQRQSLIEKTEEVQRATRLKSEFLANMSHELRTPLNVIIGFSELMLDEVPGTTNAEQKQCLTDILSSSRHLLDLINEVLDLSKVESGRMELRFTDVVVGDVAASVARHMKPILASRQQSLDVEIAPGIPPAYADAGKLEQVIRNLVDNASKYTPDGGKVKITAETEGDWCLVSVIDNGIGIKKEDVERIFEPFSRLKSGLAETRIGSGLGLAVVKQIIEKHGGQILVDSEPGKGSRFTIKLRAAKKPNKQV